MTQTILKINFIVFFLCTSYLVLGQSKIYKEIHSGHIEVKKTEIIDTLNGKTGVFWEFWKTKRKKKVENIRRRNRNILAARKIDTSKKSQINFIGERDVIRIVYLGEELLKKELKVPFKKNTYQSFNNDSMPYYDSFKIGDLPRTNKVQKAKIFFDKKKRVAIIKLDLSYSEINIIADNIYNSSEFRTDNSENKITKEKKSLPESIEVISEELIIEHIIPNLKPRF